MSESNKPQGLQVQFETQVTEQDLMNFKLYHNYHSVGGVAGLLFWDCRTDYLRSIRRAGQHFLYTDDGLFRALFYRVYTDWHEIKSETADENRCSF